MSAKPDHPGKAELAAEPTSAVSREAERIFQEQRDLERIIQPILAWGVWISAALMLIGLALALATGQSLPPAPPALNRILPLLAAMQPEGLIAAGLITLIATPILRVVISAVAFVIEGDRRYAAITGVVLLIVIASILFGRG